MRTPASTRSAFRIIDWALSAFAAVLLLGILGGALHDVSRAWDSWYYHLPFAALLGGVADRSSFELSHINQARFSGFPLLGEAVQALLWRLSGTPVAANLLAFSSVPLFALFLWRRFRVPFYLSVLGLLAVPLIQMHATSCYVDLPANTAAAALILSVMDACAERGVPSAKRIGFAVLCAAITSNMKFLLEPIVAVALGALTLKVALSARESAPRADRRNAIRSLVGILAAGPLVFATVLKNSILHHNPVFPERLSVLGWSFPGLEQPYQSEPRWLLHAPEPVRFLASIFELHLMPLGSHARWSIDQWSPPERDDYRMGGFFGAYVAFQLCLLLFFGIRVRSRPTRAAAFGFLLLTAVTCVLPQAHELRYYLCWVIVLIALNCWLSVQTNTAAPQPRALGLASAAFLCLVLFSTRLTYVYPVGVTLQELIDQQVDSNVLSRIARDERVCVRRLPFALLWAAPFHPGKHYVLKQAETPEDCLGYRPLD